MFASNTSQVANDAVFVEDIFSTTLYTGNGSTQTITNGIDLSTKGGLVWIKERTRSGTEHSLFDTVRGRGSWLSSALTDAAASVPSDKAITSFNSDGFSLGPSYYGTENSSGQAITSWTFRKQPKFFDVVTYTGNGDGTTVSHNLGSTPGCVIVKATSGADGWFVYHRDLLSAPPTNRYLRLDKTDATAFLSNWISVSDTTITFPTAYGPTASSGTTYVAYLFAHNAGGFGLSGSDNVISCGSYTGTGSVPNNITLGFEPQWLLVKSATYAGQEWGMFDSMRGLVTGSGGDAYLYANSSGAEGSGTYLAATATGFACEDASARYNNSGDTYIYIAIRRGPMKVPTSGTSVFSPQTATGYQSPNIVTDSVMFGVRSGASYSPALYSRLQGSTPYLLTSSTAAETTGGSIGFDSNNGINYSVPSNWISYYFQRAPSFFDEVCYTGTGSVLSLTHNLGVAPEFILIKCRSGSSYWILGSNFGASTYALKDDWGANASNASRAYSSTVGFNAQPTATTVSLSTNSALNVSGSTYAMWMWATCAGVSKIGTYTGTGALQTINCGFTSGARFVLITRIGVVGDVNTYVYDSARGITSSNDPYLLLESTAAEVTNTNYVDTTSTGFQVTAAASSTINVSGGTYIFLAIA